MRPRIRSHMDTMSHTEYAAWELGNRIDAARAEYDEMLIDMYADIRGDEDRLERY